MILHGMILPDTILFNNAICDKSQLIRSINNDNQIKYLVKYIEKFMIVEIKVFQSFSKSES